jgi:hypothetical protein
LVFVATMEARYGFEVVVIALGALFIEEVFVFPK